MDLDNFPTRPTARDMMDMISPIYDRSYVGKWIFEVMSLPLSLAQDTVDDLKNQAFPETATWALPYWEEAYGIITNEALSLEERRSAIVRKRNFRKPMNPARIELLIKDICGRDCTLVENVAPHTFEIKIGPGESTVNLKEIIDLLNEVKQAQKSFRIFFEVSVSVRIRAEPTFKVFAYRTTNPLRKAGQYPDPSVIVSINKTNVEVRGEEENTSFPFVVAGSRPDVSNIASVDSLRLLTEATEDKVVFPYPVAGKEPETSNLAELEKGGLKASADSITANVVYKICGSKRI